MEHGGEGVGGVAHGMVPQEPSVSVVPGLRPTSFAPPWLGP